MTRTWTSLSEADLDRAEEIFSKQDTVHWLTTPSSDAVSAQERSTPITFATLFAYAQGQMDLTFDLARALKTQPRLARDLNHLLQTHATVGFHRQAAASSTDVSGARTWTTPHGRISLHPSKAQPEQVYLLIELTDQSKALSRIVVMTPDGGVAEATLPEPVSGVIRLIANNTDDLVQMLDTVDCNVYLN